MSKKIKRPMKVSQEYLEQKIRAKNKAKRLKKARRNKKFMRGE